MMGLPSYVHETIQIHYKLALDLPVEIVRKAEGRSWPFVTSSIISSDDSGQRYFYRCER
jgi:hypothetical protein